MQQPASDPEGPHRATPAGLLGRGGFLALLAYFVLYLAGCTPMYVAPSVNAPLFRGSGEMNVGGQVGTNGLDLHAGYAVGETLALVGTFSGSGLLGADADARHRHVYAEAGLGAYMALGKFARLEFFGGFGGGSARGKTDEYIALGERYEPVESRGTYLGPFAQVDLGAGNESVEGAWVHRVRYLHYSFSQVRGERAEGTAGATFWESAVIGRAGLRHLKVEVQLGFVLPLTHSAVDTDGAVPEASSFELGWLPVHASIGLRGTFGPWD